jgi:hypothetical protein
MSKRFLMLGIVLGLVLMVAASSLRAETASIFDVFFWLLVLLVVSGLALWPSTGRDQKAELSLERRGWADRIEFGRGTKPAGGGSGRHGEAPSRTSDAA